MFLSGKIGSKNLVRVFTLTVFVLQSLMQPVLAATGHTSTSKVVLVPVATETAATTATGRKLAMLVRERIKGRANILPLETAEQLLKANNNLLKSPEVASAVHAVDETLDTYYSYKSDVDATLGRLTQALVQIRNLPPSSEVSELLVSALVTHSWLTFKSGDKTAAAEDLQSILNINPLVQLQFDYYPHDYRAFATRIQKDVGSHGTTLHVDSDPQTANVYINQVYAGVTPLNAILISGTYNVTLTADGRRSVTKTLTLADAQSKSFKTKLAWDAENKNAQRKILGQDWLGASLAEQVAIAARVTQVAQSDVAVFVEWDKVRGGYLPRAKLYNAKYSQLFKTLAYPHPIGDSADDVAKAATYLAEKITPYISHGDTTYWTKDIDRELIVDHRVATRGKKPLTKRPVFWVAVGSAVVGGVVAGILAAQSGDSSAGTGGVVIGF